MALSAASGIDPEVCATDNFTRGHVFCKSSCDCRGSRADTKMNRRLPITALLVLLAALAAVAVAPAGAATGISPAREFAPRQIVLKFEGQRHARTVGLPPEVGVREAATALRDNPEVAYAAPNYIATVSAKASVKAAWIPNDPGTLEVDDTTVPGDWVSKQWNFLPPIGTSTPVLPTSIGGIDVVGAWENLIEAKRPGARGIKIAVLDTGIAYRNKGEHFRRSPDFTSGQFAKGYDFVDRDRFPLGEHGHGTHIAGTIGEKTNNGIGLVGVAYRAKLMPVRVLDRHGSGKADDIAKGIRFAIAHGADVINMSFNFGCGKRVPGVDEELRRAYRKGVVAVASIGNLGSETCVSPPATGPRVIGVGGSTEGGCLGSYSLTGEGIDVLAPGGGTPAVGCPSILSRPIYQVTLVGGNTSRFGEPDTYVGTSMSAAHVAGVAAMTLASGVLKADGSPQRTVNGVTHRLRQTARSLGLPETQQGAGLIDAARATDPAA
ncbi:MAG: S8 family serine peptidase [Phycisphaerales bacterium]